MGVLDTIFGGGGGDIPPRSKLKNADITPDEFVALRGPLASILSGATSGTSSLSLAGIPDYQGNYSAPITSQENDLLSQLFGRAGADVPRAGLDSILSQFAQGGTALQQAGQQGILDTLSGKYLSPESNPWLSETVKAAQDDLQYDWENRVLPNLRTSFTGAGHTVTPGSFGSSAFDNAMSLAANEQTLQLQDLATQIYGENYSAERGRMLDALGLGQQETGQRIGAQTAGLTAQQGAQAQNLAERQAQTQELVDTLQAVALPRLIEQYGLDQGVTEFRNRMTQLLQLLGVQAGVSGLSAVSVQPSQSQSGILGDLIGAAGKAGSAYLGKA